MKRMPSLSVTRLLLPAALLASLAGCSILSGGDRNAVTIYSPSVQVQVDPSWPTVDWQLVLSKPSATRMVDSPRINVRPRPSELEIYAGATWAQPATDMIEDTLLRGFEDSGRIHGVARVAAGIRADYKLSTDVRRFESDYQGQATPTVVIDWTPNEDANGDALDFIAAGSSAEFRNSQSPNFAVLNRILPSTNNNIMTINGSVISRFVDSSGIGTPAARNSSFA